MALAAMSTMFLPNGTCADPGFSIVPEGTTLSDTKILDEVEPIDSSRKIEELQVHHSNIDRINALSNKMEGVMGEWTIKCIDKHLCRDRKDDSRLMHLKFTYTDDIKSWLPLDTIQLHDPLIAAQNAINRNLIGTEGWE